MHQKTKKADQEEITLESLYPTLSPAELAEVEATLERYLQLMLRMYERIIADPKSYAQLRALTGK